MRYATTSVKLVQLPGIAVIDNQVTTKIHMVLISEMLDRRFSITPYPVVLRKYLLVAEGTQEETPNLEIASFRDEKKWV